MYVAVTTDWPEDKDPEGDTFDLIKKSTGRGFISVDQMFVQLRHKWY